MSPAMSPQHRHHSNMPEHSTGSSSVGVSWSLPASWSLPVSWSLPASRWHTAKLSRAMGMEQDFSSLTFPQKLWKILESDQFRSIWWSEGGKCVSINKDLFEVEVLGREGQQVFHTQKIKSFMKQLNRYGFIKVQRDFQRSVSLPEFLAEEEAVSTHSQILYYYNPSFNRAHPCMSQGCKRRDVLEESGLDAEEMEERPPKKLRK